VSGELIQFNPALAKRQTEEAMNTISHLRAALSFYADPADYKAPFTGGMGKLWSDCGTVARTALSSIRPPNTPGDGELTMGDG
jgi:hypothetical protein